MIYLFVLPFLRFFSLLHPCESEDAIKDNSLFVYFVCQFVYFVRRYFLVFFIFRHSGGRRNLCQPHYKDPGFRRDDGMGNIVRSFPLGFTPWEIRKDRLPLFIRAQVRLGYIS